LTNNVALFQETQIVFVILRKKYV